MTNSGWDENIAQDDKKKVNYSKSLELETEARRTIGIVKHGCFLMDLKAAVTGTEQWHVMELGR